jgi:hypothetical protein
MCEIAKAYWCETRKAKKQHQCCECLGTIEVGEKYNYYRGIWDEPYSFKVCLDCGDLREEVDKEITDPEERTAFTELACSVIESQDKEFVHEFLAILHMRRGEEKMGKTVQTLKRILGYEK